MRQRIIHAVFGAGVILPLGLGLQYALSVVLARLLPVEEFGLFGFVHSLTAFLAVIATVGFSQSMMRFAAIYVENRQFGLLAGLLSTSLRIVLVAASLIVVLLVTTASFGGERAVAFLWSAVLVLPLAVDVWRESAMRGLHRTTQAIAPRQVLLPLLTLGALLALQTHDVAVVLSIYWGILVVLETLGLLRLRKCAGAVIGSVNPAHMKREWIRVSMPMAVTSLAIQGMARLDVVLVGAFLGMQATGTYAAAARTAVLASVILRGVNLVIGPMLAESYHTGQLRRFRRLFVSGTVASGAIGLPFYLMVMLYPEQVLTIFGSSYTNAALLLKILATGQFINLVTGPVGIALNMSRYQGLLSRTVMFFGSVGIVLTSFCAATVGLVGAALATAGIMATMNLFLFIFFFHRLLRTEEFRERPSVHTASTQDGANFDYKT